MRPLVCQWTICEPKSLLWRLVTHSGVELEDEGEFGTLHLGIGNGITFGSTIRAVGHVDLVVRHPWRLNGNAN
jgi:hypothetical protein